MSKFQNKNKLKRVEVLEMLAEINFKTENLIGVAEMRNRSINIKCKTRKNVLESYAKLKVIEFIYNLALYEAVNVNMILGWVPIPVPTRATKDELVANFGTALQR